MKSGYYRIYSIWTGMKQRCYNPKHIHYDRYGGRGLTIYPKWKNDFNSFYRWAIRNGYSDKLTLDRINNDIGYYPHNCRWATQKEQANNKSTNLMITYNGETKSLTLWCEELNVDYKLVFERIKYFGWTFEDAISKPNKNHIVTDIKGMKFHYLKAIYPLDKKRNKLTIWKCRCKCGNYTKVRASDLLSGGVKSCGCYNLEKAKQSAYIMSQNNITHNLSRTRLYHIWHKMKRCCYNKEEYAYKYYGAKGIKMCKSWYDDIKVFYDWAIANGYNDNMFMQRKDRTRGYAPWNCYWSEMKHN